MFENWECHLGYILGYSTVLTESLDANYSRAKIFD